MQLVLALLALLSWSTAAEAREQRIAVSLVASTAKPEPGSTITLGLRFQPKAGWHGYWSNPGDSGLPPQVEWTARGGLYHGISGTGASSLSVNLLSDYVIAFELAGVLLLITLIGATIMASVSKHG